MDLEKILRGIVIAGVFALPFIALIVMSSMFFPFITGKNFAFRAIVEVIFSAWLLLALVNEEYRPRWRPLLISVAAFVGIVALADIFSENPFKSFWSNFERMEGFVTLAHLLAYFVVAGTVIRTERVWLWFWRVSLAVSLVITVRSLWEFLFTDVDRIGATLGNPIYLAIYAVFHIFIALILLVRHGATNLERALYLFVLPIQFWVLYLTATRGATLGLVGGMLLATAGVLFSGSAGTYGKKIAAGGFIALVLLVSGAFLLKDTKFVQESRFKRLVNISLSENTVFARTIVWSMAWEGVKERPILGWGQESFNFVFNKHYDPRMYAQEQWFDRTHNIIFDWLIAAGFLGLLAYLSIFLALLWTLYHSEYFTVVQKWLLFGLLSAYGFHNLTVFDNIVSYILFFSVTAWIYTFANTKSETAPRNGAWVLEEKAAAWFGISAVIILAGFLVWSINAGPYATAKTLLEAIRQTGAAQSFAARGDIEQATAYARESLRSFQEAEANRGFGIQEVREHFAQTAGGFAGAAWMSEDLRDEWYKEGAAALARQEERVPNDARSPVLLGNLHQKYGKFDAARDAFVRALELTPNKQIIMLELADVELKRGNVDEALALSKQAYELEPAHTKAGLFYLIMLLDAGRAEEAQTVALQYGNLTTNPDVLVIFVQNNEYERARNIWQAAVEQKTDDVNAILSLVAAHMRVGDAPRAIAEVERVVAIYPEMRAMGDDIIRQLQSQSAVPAQ